MLRKLLLAGALSLSASTLAFADCAFVNDLPLRSLTSDLEAWKAVTGAMAECGNVEAELDPGGLNKQRAGFAADPSLYHIGSVANGSLASLLNAGVIRPLDDLVAAYGQHLSPNQLIKVDGQTMAISMMINTQHLMYRDDILNDLGLEVPASYDDLIASAEIIKKEGLMDYPLGGAFESGWNLAQEFVNMYLGFGGEFFDGTGQPLINNENGVAALLMMRRLTEYMAPDYLSLDSAHIRHQLQQGEIAFANLWGHHASSMDDEVESKVKGLVKMAKAPAALPQSKPASTVWWEGIVIANNITDDEAKAAFMVAMEGMDAEMVQTANDAAVWLIDGYEVGPLSKGVIETVISGAASYPVSAEMGLMHKALGDGITDFMKGEKDAATTLSAIEVAYLIAAEEAGLVP